MGADRVDVAVDKHEHQANVRVEAARHGCRRAPGYEPPAPVLGALHVDVDAVSQAKVQVEDAWTPWQQPSGSKAPGRLAASPLRTKMATKAQAQRDLSQNGYGLCNSASGP